MMAYTQSPAQAEPVPVRARHCRRLLSRLPAVRPVPAHTPACLCRTHALSGPCLNRPPNNHSNHCSPRSQGGRFSLYSGSVQGVFREVEAGKRLVMDWRFR